MIDTTSNGFSNFIVGPSNETAYDSAVAVAKNPGLKANPLLLFGPSGTGKSHLVMAVESEIKKRQPLFKFFKLNAEKYRVEVFLRSRQIKVPSFDEFLDSFDGLIFEDISMLFQWHCHYGDLDELIRFYVARGKQVIITGSRSPEELRIPYTSAVFATIGRPDSQIYLTAAKRFERQFGFSIAEDKIAENRTSEDTIVNLRNYFLSEKLRASLATKG